MTSENIIVALISGGAGFLGAIIIKLLDKPKDREAMRMIAIEQMDKVVVRQNDIIAEQDKKIDANKRTIEEQAKANEDCEYRHEVAELNQDLLLSQIDLNNVPKSTVFVLDDNKMVIMEFRNRFRKVNAIDCKFFVSPTEFARFAQAERPEVVILDYMLGETLTADDVIKDLGYEPEIFIMSQDKSIQLRIKEQGHQFFYKDDQYVLKIAKAVIKHLKAKI